MFRTFKTLFSPPRRRGAEKTKTFCVPLRLGVSAVIFLVFSAALFAADPADWIWSGRYVITEDAQHRVIENGSSEQGEA